MTHVELHRLSPATALASAITLLCASEFAGAGELSFANLAPGAGDVQISLDGDAPRRLAYGTLSASEIVSNGVPLIAVRFESDQSVLEASLPLGANDRYLVVLAGNGTTAAPYEIRVSPDHNHPIREGHFTHQDANLSIPLDESGHAVRPAWVRSVCAGDASSLEKQLPYHYGTSPVEDTYAGSNNLKQRQADRDCEVSLALQKGAEPIVRAGYRARSGERLRHFIVGDGVSEPYDVLILSQAIEQAVRVEPASADLAGVWYPPRDSGIGLQFAHDDSANGGNGLSGVMYLYREDGSDGWIALAPAGPPSSSVTGFDIVEHVGGHPDVARATLPMQRGRMDLIAHSCDEITLIPRVVFEGLTDLKFSPFPRNAFRLKRMTPGNCAASAAGELQ